MVDFADDGFANDDFDYDVAAAQYRAEWLTKIQALGQVLRNRLKFV